MAERKARSVEQPEGKKKKKQQRQHPSSAATPGAPPSRTTNFERLKAKGDEFLAALFGGDGSEPTAEQNENVDADGSNSRRERERASEGPHQRAKKRRKSAGESFSPGGFVAKDVVDGAAQQEEAKDDDGRTQAEMLARLSAHGRAFMERLGGPEGPVLHLEQQRRARRTKAAAAVAAASTEVPWVEDSDGSEGEVEHSGSVDEAASEDARRNGAAGSKCEAESDDEGAAESEDEGAAESDDEGEAESDDEGEAESDDEGEAESDDEGEAESEAGERSRPAVVVVDASNTALFSSSADADPNMKEYRKAFMSSKISKTSDAAVRRPPTAVELKEDEEDRKNDAELMSILEATKLIEDYSAKQLNGKSRRWWMAKQAVKLGMKEPPKHKKSISRGLGLKAAQDKKDVKALEEAKNIGLYHKSLKHNYAASGKPKKRARPRKDGDRGLGNVGVGKFSKGTLHISEAEIKRVERSGKSGGKGKRVGGKKGASAKSLVR